MYMTKAQMAEREAAIHKYGLEVMYARNTGPCFECWGYYQDGRRHELRDFYALEGLSDWAQRNSYGIIWV